MKPRRSSWRCTGNKELRARNLKLKVLKEDGRGSRLGDSGASSSQVQQPPSEPILGAHSDGGREAAELTGLITAPGMTRGCLGNFYPRRVAQDAQVANPCKSPSPTVSHTWTQQILFVAYVFWPCPCLQ